MMASQSLLCKYENTLLDAMEALKELDVILKNEFQRIGDANYHNMGTLAINSNRLKLQIEHTLPAINRYIKQCEEKVVCLS